MSEFELNGAALAVALKFVERRERFTSELRQHLASKGMEDQADEVIAHLTRRRIIDDRRSIQNLIERYAGRRAVGIEKLRAELTRRGAPEEEVDAALAKVSESDKTLDNLLAMKLKPGDGRAKAARFLLSRGFGEEQIESALNRYFGMD